MPRMGEGESFAGRGQGGPQAAARSAASGLRPLKHDADTGEVLE